MSPPRTKTPRGVLRPPPSAGTFAHDRRGPPGDLAAFVEHFWSVSWDVPGDPAVREVLPHPSVQLVLEGGRAEVAGVPRGRFVRRLEGSGFVFGVKFLPGGFRPFASDPISRLTGRVIPAADVFGGAGSRLGTDVFALLDMDARAACAVTFLRGRRPAPDPAAGEAGAIVRRILDDAGILRVEDLARSVGRGLRDLQRLFREYVGVSPKWVIRRYRLHEALARVDGGEAIAWPALAADLGYFDQAHFIRDFRAFVGRTPEEYRRAAQGGGRLSASPRTGSGRRRSRARA